jgi:hypothetical protein
MCTNYCFLVGQNPRVVICIHCMWSWIAQGTRVGTHYTLFYIQLVLSKWPQWTSCHQPTMHDRWTQNILVYSYPIANHIGIYLPSSHHYACVSPQYKHISSLWTFVSSQDHNRFSLGIFELPRHPKYECLWASKIKVNSCYACVSSQDQNRPRYT